MLSENMQSNVTQSANFYMAILNKIIKASNAYAHSEYSK